MRTLSNILLAALVAVAAIGCDTEEDPTHAELFVGTWSLISISDDTGDQTEGFAGLANALTATFTGANQFSITVDYREDSGREDFTLPGTYTIDEGARTIILEAATGQEIPFEYEFDNDDQIALSANSQFINPLFNPTTDYEGTVNVVIRRSVT